MLWLHQCDSLAHEKMPGANCSIYGCGSCRNEKTKENSVGPKFGIFKLSANWSAEWRSKFINAVTKDREVTAELRQNIAENKVWVCERHFKEEEIFRCKYLQNIFLLLNGELIAMICGNPFRILTPEESGWALYIFSEQLWTSRLIVHPSHWKKDSGEARR